MNLQEWKINVKFSFSQKIFQQKFMKYDEIKNKSAFFKALYSHVHSIVKKNAGVKLWWFKEGVIIKKSYW